MEYTLHFLGVGNAAAVELGSASVVLERDRQPLLMVDCGQEALTAFIREYGRPPPAVFVTHVHLDHIAGFERLFVGNRFPPADRTGREPTIVYVPAAIVPLLHERVGAYPNVVAEGGTNFWDAFRLVPVSHGFWHADLWFDVFPVRHHAPGTAWGLCLPASFLFTGDTRPIPERLAVYADGRMPLIHDCGLIGNPSHTGLDDIRREYGADLRRQIVAYHYASVADAEAIAAAGLRVARPGDRLPLPAPLDPAQAVAAAVARRLGSSQE